jgi:hypothetical protein
MAIKTLSEVATLANVERLPRPVKARTRENVVACIANGDGANRVNGMDVPGTGGALPPVYQFIAFYRRQKSGQLCQSHN